jgi:hypothetical protein
MKKFLCMILCCGMLTACLPASATIIARPTSSAAEDVQPALPLRAAFYYPWFPEAWQQQGLSPYTNYHPSLGYYSSSDAVVLQRHLEAMQYGGIQAGIASWWGQGTPSDARLPTLMDTTDSSLLRLSVYYEPEGLGDPDAGTLSADLTYLRDHYGSDPSYLRIDGRFVVFAYAEARDGCAMAARWHAANSINAYIVLKVFPGYRDCLSQPDGWHQYGPASPASSQQGYSYTISPGFNKAGSRECLGRDISRWRQNIRDMIASAAPFQLVTSFNEWGEGTAVESAQEWASASGYGAYLDALHDNGTIEPTPSPTPNPLAYRTALSLVLSNGSAPCFGTNTTSVAP